MAIHESLILAFAAKEPRIHNQPRLCYLKDENVVQAQTVEVFQKAAHNKGLIICVIREPAFLIFD